MISEQRPLRAFAPLVVKSWSAQAGSRGTALLVLDPATHLDSVDQTDVVGIFLPKFELELSQNH